MKRQIFRTAVAAAIAVLVGACSAPNSSNTDTGGTTGGSTTLSDPTTTPSGANTNNAMTTWVIGLEDSSYHFAQYKVTAPTANDTWTHVTVKSGASTFNYSPTSFDINSATKIRLMGTSSTVADGSNSCFYIANLSVKQGSNVLYTANAVPDTGFYGATPDQGSATWLKLYATNKDCLGLAAPVVANGDTGANDVGPSGSVGIEGQWDFDSGAATVTGSAGQDTNNTSTVLPDNVVFDFWILIPSTYPSS